MKLSEWDLKITFGIKTGLNEAFLIDAETRNNIIDSDPNSALHIKPVFRGREIDKYFSKPSDSYIIATLPSKKLDIATLPGIEHYLSKFGKSKLEQSGNKDSRKKTSNKWFETQDAIAFWEEFAKPKLIWKRIGSKLRFTYDESGFYALDSTCIATGDHLKYLVGVLNSKLIDFELNRFAPKTGTGDLIISVQALSPLQIPIPTKEQENNIEVLVDQIIELKKLDQETTVLEAVIDQLVYELYGLTEDEIKVVEGSVN
ncbi:MAG: type II restriction endonuclease [Saprospiraceae bacterium]|nr:type II restriction endonuclease [Saprospiraceae bacterium]